ncbi:hypothetical protein SADUNF_Sadunf16G0282800 [Salix dunnii]|uniref:Protein kinase domain-containing protein n=1 Tax=Salix dunnii TaxID=1413687 RepID=A0A835JEM6_9ROSI|nr:hypothetical protein SADUNF_Sadunf16G0282800 [Salix dunnii]
MFLCWLDYKGGMMGCFKCWVSKERLSKKSLKKSIKEYHDAKTLASFANISLKTDSSRKRYIAEEIRQIGKGNISAGIFTFRDLTSATRNFNHENLIGEGGFGRVYKGIIQKTNQVVAVKQLDRNGFQGNREFLATPLFKDRRKFTLMADPLLQGNYPLKGLYQALAVAAMCLQEEASTRPLMSDVVTALEFLAVHNDAAEERAVDDDDITTPSPDSDSD